MTLSYDTVNYKNNKYAVIKVKYKNINIPVVIDYKDVKTIESINKTWKSNQYGFISCTHTYDDETRDVYLHEIILALQMKESNKNTKDIPISHINRIGLDNRRENLIYDTVNKEDNKNLKKKKRTIDLPEESGIKPEELPTYVWYMKPNGSHGERFMIDINSEYQWKTTSSKKLSLRYKLEEAKTYLRQLKEQKPELFEEYSMNGDYTLKGKELIDSYYAIVHKAGYDYMKRFIPKNATNRILKAGSVLKKEKELLNDLLNNENNLLYKRTKKRRIITNLPSGSDIHPKDIPEYCYYKAQTDVRGGFFYIKGHPSLPHVWQGTSSQKVDIVDKFNDMIDYLNKLK